VTAKDGRGHRIFGKAFIFEHRVRPKKIVALVTIVREIR
jgi:hypothetical protein